MSTCESFDYKPSDILQALEAQIDRATPSELDAISGVREVVSMLAPYQDFQKFARMMAVRSVGQLRRQKSTQGLTKSGSAPTPPPPPRRLMPAKKARSEREKSKITIVTRQTPTPPPPRQPPPVGSREGRPGSAEIAPLLTTGSDYESNDESIEESGRVERVLGVRSTTPRGNAKRRPSRENFAICKTPPSTPRGDRSEELLKMRERRHSDPTVMLSQSSSTRQNQSSTNVTPPATGKLAAMPILYLNFAGEIMYVIEQQILQLNEPITERIYDRIMQCLACNLLSPRQLNSIFQPQPAASVKSMMTKIGLIIHSVNLICSPEKWHQIQGTVEACVKFQLLSASYDPARSDYILIVTKNHIDGMLHLAGDRGKAKEYAIAAWNKLQAFYSAVNLPASELAPLHTTISDVLHMCGKSPVPVLINEGVMKISRDRDGESVLMPLRRSPSKKLTSLGKNCHVVIEDTRIRSRVAKTYDDPLQGLKSLKGKTWQNSRASEATKEQQQRAEKEENVSTSFGSFTVDSENSDEKDAIEKKPSGLVDQISGTIERLSRNLSGRSDTEMSSVLPSGTQGKVDESSSSVNMSEYFTESNLGEKRKPGTIAWTAETTSFTCAWARVAYRHSRNMEDRWELKDGSMKGVVLGDVVMASGCDGKWLTVDVPVDSSGRETAEKWLPLEHPHSGDLLFVPTEIVPKHMTKTAESAEYTNRIEASLSEQQKQQLEYLRGQRKSLLEKMRIRRTRIEKDLSDNDLQRKASLRSAIESIEWSNESVLSRTRGIEVVFCIPGRECLDLAKTCNDYLSKRLASENERHGDSAASLCWIGAGESGKDEDDENTNDVSAHWGEFFFAAMAQAHTCIITLHRMCGSQEWRLRFMAELVKHRTDDRFTWKPIVLHDESIPQAEVLARLREIGIFTGGSSLAEWCSSEEMANWIIPVNFEANSTTQTCDCAVRWSKAFELITSQVDANRKARVSSVSHMIRDEMQQRFKRQAMSLQRIWPVPWWLTNLTEQQSDIRDGAIQWPSICLE